MWLVVDTNQTRSVPNQLQAGCSTSAARGISLPPYVLAEILLRGAGPRCDTLGSLQAYRVRIGIEPAEAMAAVAKLSASDIPTFAPFPAGRSQFGRLLNETGPQLSPEATKWANTVKSTHRAFMGGFASRAAKARAALRAQNVGKIDDFDEALDLGRGRDSFLASLVMTTVSNGRRRRVHVTEQGKLYQAAMRNIYLKHFFHAILYYVVSVSRLWKDQRLNRDPLPERDDWTDLIIALYVGRSDAIVSADGLVKAVFAAIDPNIPVVRADHL